MAVSLILSGWVALVTMIAECADGILLLSSAGEQCYGSVSTLSLCVSFFACVAADAKFRFKIYSEEKGEQQQQQQQLAAELLSSYLPQLRRSWHLPQKPHSTLCKKG